MSLIGRSQYLYSSSRDAADGTGGDLITPWFPIFSILQFVLFVGWLKVPSPQQPRAAPRHACAARQPLPYACFSVCCPARQSSPLYWRLRVRRAAGGGRRRRGIVEEGGVRVARGVDL